MPFWSNVGATENGGSRRCDTYKRPPNCHALQICTTTAAAAVDAEAARCCTLTVRAVSSSDLAAPAFPVGIEASRTLRSRPIEMMPAMDRGFVAAADIAAVMPGVLGRLPPSTHPRASRGATAKGLGAPSPLPRRARARLRHTEDARVLHMYVFVTRRWFFSKCGHRMTNPTDGGDLVHRVGRCSTSC